MAVRLPRAVVLFSFANAPGTDTSTLPDPITVAKAAVQKIQSS